MSEPGATMARTVTVVELAYCAGTSRAAIHELLEHDLLSPVEPAPEVRFPAESVERVRKIRRIAMELEVGYPAMGLVLDLLDRIERLEAQLKAK